MGIVPDFQNPWGPGGQMHAQTPWGQDAIQHGWGHGNDYFTPKTKADIRKEALLQLAVLAVVVAAPALAGLLSGGGAAAAGAGAAVEGAAMSSVLAPAASGAAVATGGTAAAAAGTGSALLAGGLGLAALQVFLQPGSGKMAKAAARQGAGALNDFFHQEVPVKPGNVFNSSEPFPRRTHPSSNLVSGMAEAFSSDKHLMVNAIQLLSPRLNGLRDASMADTYNRIVSVLQDQLASISNPWTPGGGMEVGQSAMQSNGPFPEKGLRNGYYEFDADGNRGELLNRRNKRMADKIDKAIIEFKNDDPALFDAVNEIGLVIPVTAKILSGNKHSGSDDAWGMFTTHIVTVENSLTYATEWDYMKLKNTEAYQQWKADFQVATTAEEMSALTAMQQAWKSNKNFTIKSENVKADLAIWIDVETIQKDNSGEFLVISSGRVLRHEVGHFLYYVFSKEDQPSRGDKPIIETVKTENFARMMQSQYRKSTKPTLIELRQDFLNNFR